MSGMRVIAEAIIANLEENKMNEKQVAMAAVAGMIAQAKSLLQSAKEMANENGIDFSFENIYEEVSGNTDVDWNSSNCY